MENELRLLQVEDSESDAALIVRVLQKAGYAVQATRVDCPEEMRRALEREPWDIIIADHRMAQFDAPGALEILHNSGRDIPFIVVSGSIGEELAVEMMKSGAQDYLLKDNLARLAPAVEREVREARARKRRAEAEEEQARLREQLLQAQKLETVGRLAGGIAHDFNNLLTVINGYASMLLSEAPAGEMRNGLAEIAVAGERAAALSQQLLVLSRKSVTQQKNVDVNEIVREVEKMLYRVIGEDVKFESDLHPSPQWVLADPGHLNQVLMNLAMNARDAMPHGGVIRIETAPLIIEAGQASVQPGPYVSLRFSDTGTGMTPEVLSHLFEPFFTTKQQGEGTGLGLATVYGIVKQSRGTIDVRSEPGQGATFTILLPQVAGPAPSERAVAQAPMARGTETILIVEDQEQVRKLASRLLRARGYRILEAATPEEAVTHARGWDGPISLVLTDIVMPGMSGMELADVLRQVRPSLKVLFMSGYSERIATDRLFLGPGDDYIAKPFSPAVLTAKVREVLDR